MLIVPASKVSVPLTVVIRTWVKVSDKVLSPPPEEEADEDCFPEKLATQEFPVIFCNTIIPLVIDAAAAERIIIPAVELETAVPVPVAEPDDK